MFVLLTGRCPNKSDSSQSEKEKCLSSTGTQELGDRDAARYGPLHLAAKSQRRNPLFKRTKIVGAVSLTARHLKCLR